MTTNIKILIVEDESIMALEIKSIVKKLGYEVLDIVTNYDDAIEFVKNHDIDIVLMDIHLENSRDGIQTAQEIKDLKNIPVIYLSAYSDDDTITRAAKTEPIAYLLKPFKREEIKTNLKLAVYKLNRTNQDAINTFGESLGYGFSYDLKHQNLYFDNIPIKLSVKENQLIKILVEAKGQLVPFEEIEYIIWPDGLVSESSMRTLVYRVRTKLDHKLIETVAGFGCKLIPNI
jgi:DNA-binding response OmpR family regulator